MLYKAFISYAHTADNDLAPALQTALQRIAKPWHRLRSFAIFRDQTNLAATPQLWSNIQKALLKSEFLILLLSPEAALSPWVAKEIDFWLEHRSADRLLLVLTAGDLAWSNDDQDFDWDRSSSAPAALRGVFDQEPFFVDLRDTDTLGDLSMQNPRFSERIMPLAATLHGLAANDLASEEVRQHRRTRRLARMAIISLLGLTAAAIGAAVWAMRQQGLALEQRNTALLTQSRFLADLSRQQSRKGMGATAVRLALEALPTDPSNPDRPLSPAAEGALYSAMMGAWEYAVLDGHDRGVRIAEFSPDDRLAVTVENAGRAMVWDVASGKLLFSIGDGEKDRILLAAFSPDGRYLATGSRDGRVRLFDTDDGTPLREFVNREPRIGVQQKPVSIEQAEKLGLEKDMAAVVGEVAEGSPAQRAGLQVGDVLVAVDDRPVETFKTLRPPFKHVRAGEPTIVQLYRAGEAQRLTVVPELAEDPKASPAEIRNVGFSPDGNLVYASDVRVFFWNADDGIPTGALYPGRAWIDVVKYLASGDRLFIASGSTLDQTSPQIWDTRALQRLLALDVSVLNAEGNVSDSQGPKYVIDGADVSADGKRIVTTSGGPGALWDGTSLALITRLPSGGEARFSPDGKHIATTERWNARLWDGRDGREIVVLFGHKGRVHSLDFSPHGRHLLTASEDKTARIWDVGTGREIASLRGHDDEVTSARFSHDGKTILTLSDDGSARLWRFNAFEHPVTESSSSGSKPVKISRDGSRRVVASLDKMSVEIWDSAKTEPLRLACHGDEVVHLTISPDGRYVYSVCQQSRNLWDAETGRLIKRVARVDTGQTADQVNRDGVFSADGSWLVARTAPNITELWESVSGTAVWTVENRDAAAQAKFGDNGSLLVAIKKGDSTIWTAEHRKPPGEPATPWQGRRLAIAPDGSRVAMVERQAVKLFGRAGRLIATLRGHIKAPKILRFSPDSKTLVTISADGTARVWNTEDGAALYRKSVLVDEFAGVAVFSKDSGRLLLAAGDEHMIHPVVDARTGDLLTTLRGHLYPVLDAAFSHDGSRIVTGSLDGTARLWDAATGVELVKLGGESELTREPNPFKPKKRSSGGFFSIGDFSILDESVLHVGFNADGSRAFALRRSGELRLFDIPDLATLMAEAKTHLGRPLTPQERETYFLDSE